MDPAKGCQVRVMQCTRQTKGDGTYINDVDEAPLVVWDVEGVNLVLDVGLELGSRKCHSGLEGDSLDSLGAYRLRNCGSTSAYEIYTGMVGFTCIQN